MLKQGRTFLAAELSREGWFDVGRPWDLLEANRWVLSRAEHRVAGLVENGANLVGPVTVAESARVRSGAYVEGPALIDEGSDVGPNCFIRPFTSVGKKVRVGNACEVKNSILMDGVHVGHLSYVGDSIIGENCNLGAGTITANYRLDAGTVKMLVKDDLVDTGRTKLGAVLGDNVKTGINALLMPGIKVGVNSLVGPNVVVERDVAPETIVLLKQAAEKGQLKP
jgi:bifunctional UDP-N-acetylglucosamine pyrophosphorylase/glucosamine-1-phosphate N-acetyltransferase